MSVSSLRLKGFKSFGKQSGFTFSKNFTAIVGPNGSGKSNILDALKWILGEGSSSGLRITRQSDLLFQGSDSYPPAQSAEVSLRLQNGDDRAVLRRVFSKDGSSLYLDGRKILLQELGGIKRRFNLEGEGFSLIGQGEISQTIHQKPKERRKLLDSLFGIERYREKRDDSIRKLQDAQSEAARIQTLIDELKSRRAEISDDVETAVQARGIIDSLDVLRHDYYFVRRYANEKEQSDEELKRHILGVRLDIMEKWCGLWQLALSHYEAGFHDESIFSQSLSQLQEIGAKMEAIRRRAFQLSTKAHGIKSKRSSLTEKLSSLKSQHGPLMSEREKIRAEHSQIQQELDAKQKDFSEKESLLRKSREQFQSVTEKRKSILAGLAEFRLRLSRNEADFSALASSRESLLREISGHEHELSGHEKELSSLTIKRDELSDTFTRLTSEYQLSGSKIQALRCELSHCETQYSQFSASFSYPEPVRIILQAAEKNLIRSKPVAVADVFTCELPGTAEAVEAFLGGRQYWLLVRTIDEAQEGIDFLKSHMAGRATYLPLERCRARERDIRLSFSGGVAGWAMDLVNVSDEWHLALSHLMGDLLIVRDYRTGAEIVRAGAKFPVATSEGDIFSPSGTISGGVQRQKAGAVTSRRKADEFRAKIAELTGLIEEEENRRKLIRSKAEEAESYLEGAKSEINSAARTIKSTAGNLEHLRNEYAKSEAHARKLSRENEIISGKISGLESELSGLPDVKEGDYDSLLSPLKYEIRSLSDRLSALASSLERSDTLIHENIGVSESVAREISSGIEAEKICRAELFGLAKDIKRLHGERVRLRGDISKRQEESARSRRISEKVREKLSRSRENISAVKNELSQSESKISRLESECSQMIDLWEEKYPYDKNEAQSTEGGRSLSSSLRKLERELKSLGAYNLGAISEDQSLAERIDFLTDQLDDVNTSADELRTLIDDTDSQVGRAFSDSMSKIDTRFSELFTRLFGGGEARLILQEGDSVWDRGVEIFASPPGKKLQNISQLSGGEQSLTSIALIFATLEAAGSNLAVLDEVDAALDEHNLVRFADLAREYSRNVQIISMTHRRATMERADLIYGVTMIEAGLSAVIGIDPENYA